MLQKPENKKKIKKVTHIWFSEKDKKSNIF